LKSTITLCNKMHKLRYKQSVTNGHHST